MEDNPNAKAQALNGHVPRRSFVRWKEKPFRTKEYLEFLAHYDAELRQTDGPIAVVRCKTGDELPLEAKGKLLMVKLLLGEFGSIDEANKAIGNCKAANS